jgi:exopolysaccharide production protein ExoQ
MKDESLVGSCLVARDTKTPWIIFIFLAAVFFAAQHDLFFSLRKQFGTPGGLIESAVREGNIQRNIAFSALGLFGIFNLFRRGRNSLCFNRALGYVSLFYVLWASLSIAWADDMALTSRRVVLLGMLCAGALGLVKRFSLRDIILWVFFAASAYLFIGIVSEIAFGTFRPFTAGYRFAGTLHPNHQGINCALFVLTGFAAGRFVTRLSPFFITCSFMGLGFLALTGSRTAFASCIAALLIYWCIVLPRSRKLALFFIISIALCLLMLMFGTAIFPTLSGSLLLGRPELDVTTLTGRVPLWNECLNYLQRQPLQGYGYASFLTPSRIAKMSASLNWGIPELHSAYFEVLLGVGIVGLFSYIAIIFLGIKRSIEYCKKISSAGYAFFIAIFIFSLLDGFLETSAVSHGILFFAVMVCIAHLAFTESYIVFENREEAKK